MHLKDNIVNQVIAVLILIISLNSCAVVKTPYLTSDYYKETVTQLESLKPEINTSNDSLYAGFSKTSITPSLIDYTKNGKKKNLKIPIAGFGQIKGKYATGIHDSIFVKSVALRSGNQLIIIVSADMLLMPPNIIDSVMVRLNANGLKRDQLFFTATHTHSGIGGWGYGLMAKLIAGKENVCLEKWLTEQITTAVLESVSDIHPARIGSGSFDAGEFTRNRLTGNPGDKNDEFSYLVFEQTGGRKAVIGSFSAHATTIGRTNTLLSADYPGYWQRKMENAGFDMAMFCSGSMGSQSPVGQGNAFENAEYIGGALADSLSAELSKVKYNYVVPISSMSLRIQLPDYHMRLTMKRNITTGLSNRIMPFSENVHLQAIRIHDLIWYFTPGDFSGESALLIKKNLEEKGFRSMVSGYNGSYVGYIIPGKYFYLDHYEPKMMGWFGPSMGEYTLELMEQIAKVIGNR